MIVTAHPDDETLWCGGLPLRYKDDDWTIICCSIPRKDAIRAYKFFDACKVLGARGVLFPAVEPHPSESIGWMDHIDLEDFDHIVTHNENGEYGHLHHRDVHKYVMEKYGHKPITTIGFNGPVNQTVRLTEEENLRKMAALMRYDHCLPYETGSVPKWRALLDRYCTKGGLDFATESYGGSPL